MNSIVTKGSSRENNNNKATKAKRIPSAVETETPGRPKRRTFGASTSTASPPSVTKGKPTSVEEDPLAKAKDDDLTVNRTPQKQLMGTAPQTGSSATPKGLSSSKKNSHSKTKEGNVTQIATGSGRPRDPFRLSLRSSYNKDDCIHCPTDRCVCVSFASLLEKVYGLLSLKRRTELTGRRNYCAKSILPPFVTRLVSIIHLTEGETFYDLGCGNGSVLFQVAYMTGARCVGIELCPHNAQVARDAWKVLKPLLEKKAGRPMPEVEILTGDLTELISQPSFVESKSVIWTANLLMPKALTHYMAERFRSLPVGSRVLCFDDLYPHSRSVAAIRDPEAFAKFEMVDYVWQEMSVEWCAQEGDFYFYRRK